MLSADADVSLGPGDFNMTIAARYEDGFFKPIEHVNIPEGAVVEVNVRSYPDLLRGKPRSVKEFAFCGMWKDREEMADSVEYVNSLRRNLRD